jgi:hypothetical protein
MPAGSHGGPQAACRRDVAFCYLTDAADKPVREVAEL